MNKNRDQELVTKGEMKKLVRKYYGQIMASDPAEAMCVIIDSLPAVPQGKDSWVLEKFKKYLCESAKLLEKDLKDEPDLSIQKDMQLKKAQINLELAIIKDLESQAPAVVHNHSDAPKLTGAAWVLEEFNKWLQGWRPTIENKHAKIAYAIVQDHIKSLWSQAPAVPARQTRPDAEIERAIENLEKDFDEMKTQNYDWGSYWELRRRINLLRWTLNQPQKEKGYPGSTWTDEELLGKEK